MTLQDMMDESLKNYLTAPIVEPDFTIENVNNVVDETIPNTVVLSSEDAQMISASIRSTLLEINSANEVERERRHQEILQTLNQLIAEKEAEAATQCSDELFVVMEPEEVVCATKQELVSSTELDTLVAADADADETGISKHKMDNDVSIECVATADNIQFIEFEKQNGDYGLEVVDEELSMKQEALKDTEEETSAAAVAYEEEHIDEKVTIEMEQVQYVQQECIAEDTALRALLKQKRLELEKMRETDRKKGRLDVDNDPQLSNYKEQLLKKHRGMLEQRMRGHLNT